MPPFRSFYLKKRRLFCERNERHNKSERLSTNSVFCFSNRRKSPTIKISRKNKNLRRGLKKDVKRRFATYTFYAGARFLKFDELGVRL